MELDFDKEIDALLRRSRRDAVVPDSRHLDADEIAAFAENALPARSRPFYIAHLADCDRCREILAYQVGIEGESAAFAAPRNASSEPWYRRLFALPILAYGMGALVLLFGGFFGYLILQNSDASKTAEVSQTRENEPSTGGPFAPDESSYAANTNSVGMNRAATVPSNTTYSTANSAMNMPVGAATPAPASPPKLSEDAIADAESKVGIVESVEVTAGQPAPKDKPKEEERDEKADAKLADQVSKKQVDDLRRARDVPPPAATSGPSNSNYGPRQDNLGMLNSRMKPAAKEASAVRAVGGKKFQLRGGVWYDTAFKGQSAKNIRRGTDEYRKLDSNIRSIAETLGGTVVIVSNNKAYRIQ